MKQVLTSILIIILLNGIESCKREMNAYIDPDAPAPEEVNDVHIINRPGGAFITYKVPGDTNLLYVKAEYEIRPGVFRVAKASYYSDTLQLVGYGDTLEHAVKIYSVGRNGKESDALSFQVKPLSPPIMEVFKALVLGATFGGVYGNYENNSTNAALDISVICDTTGNGTWAKIYDFYTSGKEGTFITRGLDSVERKFGIYVTDHWNNHSDTLFETLKPLFEEKIPKNNWKLYPLPNDLSDELLSSSHKLNYLWNDKTGSDCAALDRASAPEVPVWFTVDMGVKAVFSRMVLYNRLPGPFDDVKAKKWAIYGSNSPSSTGSWESWDSLGTFEFRKPSGLPGNEYTADDLDYASKGEDFSFPSGLGAYRYFRFKLIDTYATWGGLNNLATFQISEITFHGQIEK